MARLLHPVDGEPPSGRLTNPSLYEVHAQMSRYTLWKIGATLLLLLPVMSFGAEPYVFGAPPRGTVEAESKVYEPIARYLSDVTGRQIEYQHPDNWLSYQQSMQQGAYDLVFDGPHFVSWRITMLGHEPLARLPGELVFVVATLDSNAAVQTIQDLTGRTVCALAPPNLATLTMLSHFENPSRQPILVPMKSFKQGHVYALEGRCAAGVWRDKALKKFGSEGMRAVFTSEPVANQAFSAGPRFTAEEKSKIANALLSPEAPALKAFNDRFNRKKVPLKRAGAEEYAGLWSLLKDVWGFEVTTTAQ